MRMLAKYSSAAEAAMHKTARDMPITTVIVLLVLIALALVWLFRKR